MRPIAYPLRGRALGRALGLYGMRRFLNPTGSFCTLDVDGNLKETFAGRSSMEFAHIAGKPK